MFNPFKKNPPPKVAKKKLRPYQLELSKRAIAYLLRDKDFCIALPAQSGKTLTVFNTIIQGGFIALFVTPRKFITFQGANEASDMIGEENVAYINSKTKKEKIAELVKGKQIVVMDLQTAYNRIKSGHLPKNMFTLKVIDEIHFSSKKDVNEDDKIVDKFKALMSHCPTLGVTATPYDEKGRYLSTLGHIDDEFNTAYMVENGYLSKIDIFHVDIFSKNKKIEKQYNSHLKPNKNGGYTDSSVANATNSQAGKILTSVALKYTFANKFVIKKGERALVYAGSTEQADLITSEYRKQGCDAYAVHSKVKNALEIVDAFNANRFDVLVSVDMLIMGIAIKNVKKSIYYRGISSRITETQVKARGAGGDAKSTAVPNIHIDFTPTFSKMGHPHDFKPHWGEKEVKVDSSCVSCGAILSDFPLRVVEQYEIGDFNFVVKECLICGNKTESNRTTNKDELMIDSFNLVKAIRQEQILEKSKSKKFEFFHKNSISKICNKIENRGLNSSVFRQYFESQAKGVKLNDENVRYFKKQYDTWLNTATTGSVEVLKNAEKHILKGK